MKGNTHGRKTFHHPEVGDLTLGYQSMELEGTPGHCPSPTAPNPAPPNKTIILLDLIAHEHPSNKAAPSGGASTNPHSRLRRH